MMLCLEGSSAASAFRIARLQAAIADRVARISGLSARFVHFVQPRRALMENDRAVLERLLRYGPKNGAQDPATGQQLLVVPRPGTISPWSSRATDIARRCGLANIGRLERGVFWHVATRDDAPLNSEERAALLPVLHDRMTEVVLDEPRAATQLFERRPPVALQCVDLRKQGRRALEQANQDLGLALSEEEIEFLHGQFSASGRNPTDVELMMFAQVNSEHCRHKIFNAQWILDGAPQAHSLFDMIRNTHRHSPAGTLSAYSDNSAVIEGMQAERFFCAGDTYGYHDGPAHIMIKVETHNHPTAISPFAGAATGSGGEIRDEAATGRGARPKAGITGFSVSNLRLPGAHRPWEQDHGKPARIASALQIMLEGPVGGAAFNNEFGRPNIGGYFRVFEMEVAGAQGIEVRGYHKPIMLAGGLGNIRPAHAHKEAIPPGAKIVLLGGPAMLIGLGGGAASSMASGSRAEDLDFASVQRANPEMQRRCQAVIDQCWAADAANPILSIHDVGAGGLSNALPELVHDAGRGGHFQLREVPSDDPGMSPMEIWCNEAQERFVLAVEASRLETFLSVCARERCPCAVVGEATADGRLTLQDARPPGGNGKDRCDRHERPIDMELAMLLGKPPQMLRRARHRVRRFAPLETAGLDAHDAVRRVLRLPGVADKSFLINIADRTVGGLVCRDQMVGPWQVPVADCGVTAAGFRGVTGEAMAIGERAPLALIDPAASARMAVGEALTNIVGARIDALSRVKLSANWMAAAGHAGEDAALFDAVRAVGLELCPALGIAVPVGKDSMSMKTVWEVQGKSRAVTSPVSLVVSAFAPVLDVRMTLTPQLRTDAGPSELLLLDIADGQQRLGGSALAQVYSQLGARAPDVDDPRRLADAFALVQQLNEQGLILACHDRSDGGLFVSLCEMAFAGRAGWRVHVDALGGDPLRSLFCEELGLVLQTRVADRPAIERLLGQADSTLQAHVLGEVNNHDELEIHFRGQPVLRETRMELHRLWSETTWRMQSLRDHPQCAQQEYDRLLDADDPGIEPSVSFDPDRDVAARFIGGAPPGIAILREQGVNGHVEMAAAFDRAGFRAVDVTMSDIIDGRRDLSEFSGFVACGGFSFGDVLGAGEGWAKSILFNTRARDVFAAFFQRGDSFALGVCNGCQMMANLRELIPGAERWPHFVRNRSEQFEARFSLVEVPDNPSLLFAGMTGSRLPVAVAHGEGRAEFSGEQQLDRLVADQLVALRYVDHHGDATERYPANPNGSPGGITGLTTADGRFSIMMPHPERVFRTVANSWHPQDWGEDGPWLRMFRNARVWVG